MDKELLSALILCFQNSHSETWHVGGEKGGRKGEEGGGRRVMTEHISRVIFPRESRITLAHIMKQNLAKKKIAFH